MGTVLGLAKRLAVILAVGLLLGSGATAGYGQRQPVHYRHAADMPPGVVGRDQLTRGGPLGGYFQPVQIRAPQGARIALAAEGRFWPSQPAPVMAGMLIGHVYRLQVTQIPELEGLEVYPTIELVNRLYPPPTQQWRFPVPIELSQEELSLALEGHYVTRVIYLEPPEAALPVREDPGRQRYFEVPADEDPLQAADRLGRPMAILRMGSRIPDQSPADGGLLLHTPPLLPAPTGFRPAKAGPVEEAIERPERNYPRLPLP